MTNKAYNRKYYRKNRERLKAEAKTYRRKNRQSILAQRKKSYQCRKRIILARNWKWRSRNKHKISLQKRLQRLRKMGLSAQELQKARPGGNGGWLVDHNHKTRKFRGILCNSCNTLLGFSKDSIKILKNAISYLKKEKQRALPI
jgi:Recombination endonuclease VII/HECT-like Ubiquitin-conjugating enzyme (E2)-binding